MATWNERIIKAHTSVTKHVSHGGRLKSDRYFVWQEDGEDDFKADNIHTEEAVTGSTDLFTKQEFDPWRKQIERAFDEAGILWRRSSTQYEPETGFWHHEWYWTVV